MDNKFYDFYAYDFNAKYIKLYLSERRLYIITEGIVTERDFLLIAPYPLFFIGLFLGRTVLYDGVVSNSLDYFEHDFAHAEQYYTFKHDHSDEQMRKYYIMLDNLFQRRFTRQSQILEAFLFFVIHEQVISLETLLSNEIWNVLLIRKIIERACAILLFLNDRASVTEIYNLFNECLLLFNKKIEIGTRHLLTLIDVVSRDTKTNYTDRKRRNIELAASIPDNEDTLKLLARMEAISV